MNALAILTVAELGLLLIFAAGFTSNRPLAFVSFAAGATLLLSLR
jgi:hypothetical protein